MENLRPDLHTQEAKKLCVQRCVRSLVHAWYCRDANCRLRNCQKMKRVSRHFKLCQRKNSGDCPICRQVVALCCYHAKQCRVQETKCPVPLCLKIKHKLKQQPPLQELMQQAHPLHWRMAVTNTQTTVPFGALPGSSVAGGLTGGAASPAGITVSPPCNMIGIHSTHTPDIGLKHGIPVHPAGGLQVVEHVQEEAAQQQVPHLHANPYGRVTLPGVAGRQSQVMPPPLMAQPLGGQMDPGHLIPMEQWIRYPSNPALQQNLGLWQPNPQMMQQQQSVVQVPPQPPQGLGMSPTYIPGPGPNIQSQPPGMSSGIVAGATGAAGYSPGGFDVEEQQLYFDFTPEQQTQIFQILKSNPQLLEAFFKQQQVFQLAQAVNQVQAANAGQGPEGVMVLNQHSEHHLPDIMSQEHYQLQHMMSQQQQQQ